jgi:hypothetical protein
MQNFSIKFLSFFIVMASSAHGADVFNRAHNVVRHDAFEHVTGMTEAAFNANQAANMNRVLRQRGGQRVIRNQATNREWVAGDFDTASVAQLRAAVNAQPARAAGGTFSVVAGFNPMALTPAQRAGCDVTALQADPANAGAFFQVASNFNCLEGVAPLTAYTHARAQGELAAVSAFPGTILRYYGLGQIDLLHNLPPIFRLAGAGPLRSLSFRGRSAAELEQAAQFDYRQVEVGIHLSTEVTFGAVLGNQHEVCAHQQIISQIYTSALNIGLNPLDRNGSTEAIARNMLRASYEGTLLATALYGEQDDRRQQLFLTLMGCGVFNNRLEWVADVLEALRADIQALNLDVTLVVFDGNGAGMANFLPRMRALANRTGGNYEEIRPGGRVAPAAVPRVERAVARAGGVAAQPKNAWFAAMADIRNAFRGAGRKWLGTK